jgi:hypothetical protein
LFVGVDDRSSWFGLLAFPLDFPVRIFWKNFWKKFGVDRSVFLPKIFGKENWFLDNRIRAFFSGPIDLFQSMSPARLKEVVR